MASAYFGSMKVRHDLPSDRSQVLNSFRLKRRGLAYLIPRFTLVVLGIL
jgi:hypothetical protein